MTRRTTIISTVGAYFASKGGAMTMEEYKKAEDAPIRFVLIKRTIGSWARLLNMIGDIDNYKVVEAPKETPKITPQPKVTPAVEKTKGA